jgi:hypothetical protein
MAVALGGVVVGPEPLGAAPVLNATVRITTDDLLNPNPDDGGITFHGDPFEGIVAEKRSNFVVRPCLNCFGGGSLDGAGVARARPGEVGALASAAAESFGSGIAAGVVVVDSDATFHVSDIILVGAPATVSGLLLIDLDGLLVLDASTANQERGFSFARARQQVDIDVTFGSTVLASPITRRGTYIRERVVESDGDFTDVITTRGLLEDYFGGGGVVVFPFANVPTARPLQLRMHIRANAFAQLGGNGDFVGVSAMITDFCCSLSLPVGGPVFELPPGVTVNSEDAGIVDNHWVAAATPPPFSVPAPGSLALVGGAVAAFLAIAHRRRLFH